MKSGTLVLTRPDVASLLSIEECIAAVEHVFRLYGQGRTEQPAVLGIHSLDGGFHIKAGLLKLEHSYFAAKINANFPQNPKRLGLPTIQGVIVLFDAENGYPLAVMDSIEITTQRTGAATAVAAKYLARPESKTLTICGCGNQGRISMLALTKLFPIKRVFAYDLDKTKSESLARDGCAPGQPAIIPVAQFEEAAKHSDICVSCTPAREFFLKPEHIAPGTFIAAVGADNEDKQELDPALLGQNKVVADVLDQCAAFGELHHALDKNVMSREQVHAELGEVVAGIKPGRVSGDEIIIFDSTGMALQDVIVAAFVYEKALNEGVGLPINLIG